MLSRILITAATVFEIEPALLFLQVYKSQKPNAYIFGKLDIEVCITGVGMVNTAFQLGKLNQKTYDLAINAGVAGAFGNYEPGTVLNVTDDCFSEMGAEDGDRFLPLDALGLGEQRLGILNLLHNEVSNKLPLASGITVNTVHGHELSIEDVKQRYQADVETMEGAAFILAANAFHWKAIQLRAISNKVERRNKANWQMSMAINNLNHVLIELLQNLSHQSHID